MTARAPFLLAAFCLLTLGACEEEAEQAQDAVPVRPVLTRVVERAVDRQVGFAGTIRSRYEVDRGFRVLGSIIGRDVDVGDLVEEGQTLATLDPLVFDLAIRSAEAGLAAAQSALANAVATESRRKTLLDRAVISQLEYDAARQERAAAEASVVQAQADLDKARDRRGYTILTADIAGVVTGADAQVGQTVSAGQKVVTLARLDSREAVIDVPESLSPPLEVGAEFEITLQANPAVAATGTVREIAPRADSMTRTRRVEIALDEPDALFRLGATITATPVDLEAGDENIVIPASAVREADGLARVWLVDEQTRTVSAVPVQLGERKGDTVRVEAGLSPGSRIVVAGVNSLSEGQVVRIDEGASR